MTQPLAGLFVLDFSTLLPGPLATLLLAEAGAEVLKVERPGRGDEMRSYQPQWSSDSINFALLNRGKKSISLDLKNEADRRKLAPLIERADVIVEQYRPGVMQRLGLDYDSLAAAHPTLIYCSITGYGQNGPKRDQAGHDLNYIGDAGLLSLSMGTAAHPVIPPALIADVAGGAYPAFMNILLALHERRQTGRGRYIDVAMTDNLFTFMYWALGNGLAANAWPGNGADLVTGGTPRYRLYFTRDRRAVAAAPIEQKFWDTFCDIIALEPRLRDDSLDPAATTTRIAAIIATETAAYWAPKFAAGDCCCSIVSDIREALVDPQFESRNLFKHVLAGDFGERLPALPVPLAPAFRAPMGTAVGAPRLGEHNEEFL